MESAALTDVQHAILANGEATLSPYTNVAAGSPGWEVGQLYAKGLLRKLSPDYAKGPMADWRFVITDKGRAALAAHAKSALAALSPAE